MKGLIALTVALLLVASLSDATNNAFLREHILEGLEYSYEENYEKAKIHFSKAIEEDPEDPSGYFFLCGLYGLYMSDFSTDEVDGLFLINLLEATWAARKRIERDRNDAWARFYLGGSYAYRAFREQQKGNLWTALRHALTAVNELKMSVLCDSTLYDAYMGIGSYHYFINHLWSYIPLLGRDPGKGIEEIRLAVERATFVKVPAQNGLIHILLREERFDEALRLAEDLVLRYPRSRTFHWTLAEVYEDMEDWENAAGTYHKLLSMIEEGQPDNYYNMAYCGERLSYCWYMSGRYNESLLVCVRMFGLLENASDGQRTERLKEALKVLLNKIRKAKLEQ